MFSVQAILTKEFGAVSKMLFFFFLNFYTLEPIFTENNNNNNNNLTKGGKFPGASD